MALDLEQLVADKVHGRLEELNGTVGTLVAQALNRELDTRVAAIVQLYLEARATPDEIPPEPGAAAKRCYRCGADKPVGEFERGRGTCRGCRREQVRESKQHRQQEPEEPAVPCETPVEGMPAVTRDCQSGGVIRSLVPDRVEATPSGGGADRPFRWNWVHVNRIGGRGRFAELMQRGWIESDGNGRVRPTGSFPIDVAAAFAALD